VSVTGDLSSAFARADVFFFPFSWTWEPDAQEELFFVRVDLSPFSDYVGTRSFFSLFSCAHGRKTDYSFFFFPLPWTRERNSRAVVGLMRRHLPCGILS